MQGLNVANPPSYKESEWLHQAAAIQATNSRLNRLSYLITAIICVEKRDFALSHAGCEGCAHCLAARRVATPREARQLVQSAFLTGDLPCCYSANQPVEFVFFQTTAPRGLLRLSLIPLTRLSLPSPELFNRTSWTSKDADQLEAVKAAVIRQARTVCSVCMAEFPPAAGGVRAAYGIRRLFKINVGEQRVQTAIKELQDSQFANQVALAVDAATKKLLRDLKATTDGEPASVLGYQHAVLESALPAGLG
ncbi:hypothetical protein BOX15_Mlig028523g1 [Macrostomum lignano]|uniref:Uncharacterized protein n=1 Tax=Macrostomum lignano TaxID=282301 RepID=A0A267F9N1_9PLAT|nr:hypothetical protein BOX15_Mlig028523g1 [Macrostomum lignano]